MKRYEVMVPPPSAKRMLGNGKLVVVLHDGWEGDQLVQVEPTENATSAQPGLATFEIPDRYEWSRSTSIIDGWSFDVYVEWSNNTGSRKQRFDLVPRILNGG